MSNQQLTVSSISKLAKLESIINSGSVALGAVLMLNDPIVAEIAGLSGMDFIWIDNEHGLFNPETMKNMILSAAAADCATLVRVRCNDANLIKPILDMNPAGIIIPMVKNAEEAIAAVSACRYPPQGIRGCGIRRACGYNQIPLKEYFEQSNNAPWVIPQIEHIDALVHLDEILKVPGINSICVGPCDLAVSMGYGTDMDNPEVNKVIDEICAKVKKANIPLGTASGNLPRWIDRGINWFAGTSDNGILAAGFRNFRKSL
jgi:2-keto-3-deoxy-L-rhamnonate aldolase RhmA